ncbi:hypothetical protein [Enterobacter bugandensis]|uniref:hypothetical protein n=1 Tax=Enterobacter bugandensis TaxID=881260 RepID=UPI002D797D5B|nr:hypothetical protein [Enterobacter bugandensis]WRT51511.1 hypothetical protein VK758_23190 [Enterobacter bugandensis]
MSTITKEWLQQKIADMEAARDEIPFGLDEDDSNTLAALRIALASLEAEAVAWVIEGGNHDTPRHISTKKEYAEAYPDRVVTPLYTAPPAPVSVPDFGALTKCIVQRLVDYGAADDDAIASAEEFVYNACRDVMLQGAEKAEPLHAFKAAPLLNPSAKGVELQHANFQAKADGNSPVIPDCSCRTCRPVTMTDMRFVVCPECGNKRCPHANDHRNACTGSNEPGQEGSAYPAAPQQEVTQALAKGMERYGDAMQELAKKEVK